MFQLFSSPGFKLTPEQRTLYVRVALVALVLLILGVGFYLGSWAHGATIPGEDPRSDLQVLAGAVLFRFPAALGLVALAVFLAVVLFRALERSTVGHQLITWRINQDGQPDDPAGVPAARTLGSLIFLGFVFMGTCTLLAAVVR